MAANAQITVEPYSGTEKESFRQFEQLFRGFIGVAAIPNAQQANFLQLHLRGDALRYFQTLPEATRQDVELSLTALRDHFCNTQLQEVHILRLEQKKFDPKIDTPENFLVTLQTAAQRAYPPPNLPAVAPLANGADAAEQARFARETAARQERINAEEEFKNEQVKRIFQKAMPGWLRSKMMEQPPNTTVQELCTLARQQMTIRDLCRKDDYPEDGFNEISTTVSDNLISALSKLNATQEAMERKLSSMDDRIKNQETSSYRGGSENNTMAITGSSSCMQNTQWPNSQNFTPRFQPRGNFNYRGNPRYFGQSYPRNNQPRYYHPRQRQQFNPQSNTNPQNLNSQQMQTHAEVRLPNSPYFPVTPSTKVFCYTCGYPNHKSNQCSQRSKTNSRGTSFPFPRQPKN